MCQICEYVVCGVCVCVCVCVCVGGGGGGGGGDSSPVVTGEFLLSRRVSNVESVLMSRCHHALSVFCRLTH